MKEGGNTIMKNLTEVGWALIKCDQDYKWKQTC